MERETIMTVLSAIRKSDAPIADDALLFEDLGLSSLEMMTALFRIGDALDIAIDYAKLAGTRTVGQLIDAIKSMT